MLGWRLPLGLGLSRDTIFNQYHFFGVFNGASHVYGP